MGRGLSCSTPRLAIKPPRLRAGDVVGVVAPSNEVVSIRAEVEHGMEVFESWGLWVREGAHLWASQDGREAGDRAGGREGRGGTREEQLADLHAMWADPEVKAIFAASGGITAITLVDGLDYELIARQPKMFVGMSNVSFLLTAIWAKTSLVTFHTSCLDQGL